MNDMTLYSAITAVVIFLCSLMVPCAYAVDTLKQIHPYIRITGEYSDNLDLTYDHERSDFYTTIAPGIKFSNMDERSGVNLDAYAGYVFYSRYDDLNYATGNISLDAKYLSSSHFNFYVREALTRTDDPREREYFTTLQDNKYVLANERRRAVYWRNVFEPVVEYQFGPENRIGVKYRNNLYYAEDIDNIDSRENYIGPFLTYWFNPQHGIALDYGYTNGYFESDPDLNGHRIGGAYMMRVTPKTTLSLKGAYTIHSYTDDWLDYEIYETAIGISHLFSSTLSASAEIGYYWMEPDIGSKEDGVTFKGDLIKKGERTTYLLSLQGGYIQDLFTSQNRGFQKYYRATGSVNHFLDRRLSVGALGSVEWIEDPKTDQQDTIWSAGARISYLPFQWLNVTLGYNYQQDNPNDHYWANEYKENRVMLSFTATY